ncbi:MAG TPA: hypothetical protein VF179_12760 [Thermoanaerobaculia bacterium]|nr:hypothetical protein [Thermoanaerobaculia bacterium]
MSEIISFLDRKFKRNTRLPLAKLVEPIKYGSTIKPGTLVIMASGDRKLRLKILDKETPHKGFSEPLALNTNAHEHRVTPNYLLWYLSHEAIRDHLLSHATGSVILRVPRVVIHSLPVPLPSRAVKDKGVDEVVLTKKDDPLSRLIDQFYHDYRMNLDRGSFRTAVILAGAICEVILYQLLLEHGVDQSMLSNDRNLALSKLLDYVRLLKLDRSEGLPLTHLNDIRKKRNSAIHAGPLAGGKEFSKSDLDSFDHIIRYFGI